VLLGRLRVAAVLAVFPSVPVFGSFRPEKASASGDEAGTDTIERASRRRPLPGGTDPKTAIEQRNA